MTFMFIVMVESCSGFITSFRCFVMIVFSKAFLANNECLT